jgi:hypothetical protein
MRVRVIGIKKIKIKKMKTLKTYEDVERPDEFDLYQVI